MLKDDLEALTGQIIEGDITPVVIGMLKSSPYKKDLLKYLPFCSDKELIKRVKEGCERASNESSHKNTVKEDNSRPSLEKWLADRGLDESL